MTCIRLKPKELAFGQCNGCMPIPEIYSDRRSNEFKIILFLHHFLSEDDHNWLQRFAGHSVTADEGWLYLCIFLDLFSRRVVGWATSNRINAELAVSALEAGVGRRKPEEGLITHSDRGSQFCSRAYRAFCASKGIKQSMGKTGSAYDNAITETFFSTLKKELIHGERFKTRKEATAAIFDHIEVFYNRTRMHSSLGYQSPVMYERDVA